MFCKDVQFKLWNIISDITIFGTSLRDFSLVLSCTVWQHYSDCDTMSDKIPALTWYQVVSRLWYKEFVLYQLYNQFLVPLSRYHLIPCWYSYRIRHGVAITLMIYCILFRVYCAHKYSAHFNFTMIFGKKIIFIFQEKYHKN